MGNKIGNLYMLCGLPGSGKSTYAKNWTKDKDEIIWVSRDEVRYTYIDPNNCRPEDYYSREKEVYAAFVTIVREQLLKGRDVVADATFLNRGSRAKFLRELQLKPNTLNAIVFNTPYEICLERNNNREGIRRVPEKVIRSMKNSYSNPTSFEGFDNIYFRYKR